MDLLQLLVKKVNKADNRIRGYEKRYKNYKSQNKDDYASVTRLHAVKYAEGKQRSLAKKGINFNKESIEAGKKFIKNFSKTDRRYAEILDRQMYRENTEDWGNNQFSTNLRFL